MAFTERVLETNGHEPLNETVSDEDMYSGESSSKEQTQFHFVVEVELCCVLTHLPVKSTPEYISIHIITIGTVAVASLTYNEPARATSILMYNELDASQRVCLLEHEDAIVR